MLGRLRANIVFSKGGFVAFPVVIGAWLRRIPIVAHESDLSPGLANKLCFPFVTKLCLTFPAAQKFFTKKDKLVVTGTPIRQQLFKGNKQSGLSLCGFTKSLPCILVIGGSLGANVINFNLRQALPLLCKKFQIIHLCGKGKIEQALINSIPNYFQLEYADLELPNLFAASDLVISRAGANSLYEILALKKPHILIPLSLEVSRGDQLMNANHFSKQCISHVIEEKLLTPEKLSAAINEVYANRKNIINKIAALGIESATTNIIKQLYLVLKP